MRSPRESCIKNREVKVFKARPVKPDILVGKDHTNENGRYVVPKPSGVTGKFYARAKRRVTGNPDYDHVHRCRRALSRIIKAP